MKINKIEYLINKGPFAASAEMAALIKEIRSAIISVTNPKGSAVFSIRPVQKGNGVKPIKESCMKGLKKNGWELEKAIALGAREKPGPIDAAKSIGGKKIFALEWETGNVSSSHRALNKMCLGLMDGVLAGGVLILPSREFYQYLTDRVGNFAEIEPYFPIWRSLPISEGVLAVIEVEHDAISNTIRSIRKGTDGRALK